MRFVGVIAACVGLIAFGGCPGPARAGLVDQPRGGLPIIYTETEPVSVADADPQLYWKSELDELFFDSHVKPRLYVSKMRTSSGQDLVVTMLTSAEQCGNRGCPIRVATPAGRMLVDALACGDTGLHSLTDDGNVLVACDDNIAIFEREQRPNGPVPGVAKMRLWHNGSIVEALTFSDGAVQIRYLDPRPDLPVVPGGPLFRGIRDRTGRLTGIAYTFSSDCADAPYDVTGVMTRQGIRLAGAAPHRNGRSCEILAYTSRSPHAQLSFIALGRSDD